MGDLTTTGPGRPEIAGCPECGALQRVMPWGDADILCYRCGTPVERAAGRSADAALACAVAALLLLFPANLLPVLRSRLLGASLEAHVFAGATAYWQNGWPLMAVFVALLVVVIPFVRSMMLVAVLGSLRLGNHGRWQGLLFRYAEDLRPWSLPAVYVLAGIVTYARVAAQLDIKILVGGWCFVFAALLLLVTDASLDARRVWQEIRPQEPVRHVSMNCDACGLIVPTRMEGARCPRCRRRLHERKPQSISRTAALTAVALALYPAGILLPMIYTIQPGGLVERNVVDGVMELFAKGFWYFGVVLFTASIAIPVLKLVALVWLMFRVKHPRAKGLVLRTKIHRVLADINPWSFTDPFIVALTIPLLSYPGIADSHAGPGALPFALVVVLTMLASRYFDTRLMWDAAEKTNA
jgi:paraquat-inducible protein A